MRYFEKRAVVWKPETITKALSSRVARVAKMPPGDARMSLMNKSLTQIEGINKNTSNRLSEVWDKELKYITGKGKTDPNYSSTLQDLSKEKLKHIASLRAGHEGTSSMRHSFVDTIQEPLKTLRGKLSGKSTV